MDASEDVAPAVRSILAAARDRPIPDERVAVDGRSLRAALADARAAGRRPVIAEVKPTSPTTQGKRDDDPVDLARSMVLGGAAALSVLTEPEHFGGDPTSLRRIRAAVDVPVLRKDFLLSPRELDRVAADAVLLIPRFLDGNETADLGTMVEAARARGIQPLVEVHAREALDRADAVGADVIGINNRDLARLTVDLGTFERLAPVAPDDATLIAESGISDSKDADRMLAAGADGLLIGTAIMSGNVRETTARLTRRTN